MGVEALKLLGFRSYQAHRAARIFKRHEQKACGELFALWEDKKALTAQVREHVTELERMMQSDQRDFADSRDHSWEADSPTDEP